MKKVLAEVDGFQFKGVASFGEMGCILKEDGLAGWEDGPGTRGERIDVPQGDGQFDLPVFRTSRSPKLSGHAFARDQEELTALGEEFTGLLAEGPGTLTVQMGGVTRWANVRLGDDPLFKSRGSSPYATFTLSMWAPDPVKYGELREFPAGVPVGHYGNVTAAPIHTLSGSMPGGYTLVGPAGRQFIVTAPLVPGVSHRIDMQTGYLYIGDVLTFGGVSRPDVWGIPKATEVVHSVAGAGSADLVTSVLDTFI